MDWIYIILSILFFMTLKSPLKKVNWTGKAFKSTYEWGFYMITLFFLIFGIMITAFEIDAVGKFGKQICLFTPLISFAAMKMVLFVKTLD